MSGFCAASSSAGNCCDCPLLARMVPALAPRGDRIGTWSQGLLGLAMTEWNGRSAVQLPYRSSTQDLVIAADLRLDYRSDLLAALQERGTSAQGPSDIEVLAAAYQTWGTACVRYLEGDYAFVLWDASRSMLFGARSITGQRPFLFHHRAGIFLCASEARQLLATGSIQPQFHAGWMASWLVDGHDSWDCTVYAGIEKLPAGYTILLDDEHGIRIEAFWQPWTSVQRAVRDQQDYIEQFKRLLFAAVRSRFHPSAP